MKIYVIEESGCEFGGVFLGGAFLSRGRAQTAADDLDGAEGVPIIVESRQVIELEVIEDSE